MLFAIILFESILGSQNSYLFYFMFVIIFCILSWLMFNFAFEIRDEKVYEKLSSEDHKIKTDSMLQMDYL